MSLPKDVSQADEPAPGGPRHVTAMLRADGGVAAGRRYKSGLGICYPFRASLGRLALGWLILIVSACATVGNARAQSITTGPYRMSPSGRYLVDGRGEPFFVHGEAAWSAIVNLSDDDTRLYLDDCQRRGFNAILVNVLEHQFSAHAPANLRGVLPFSGAAFQSTPSAAYMEHVRWVVQAAAQRGIVVFANPAYLGFDGGSEGWHRELEAAGASAARSWGAFVGNALSGSSNLVWHLFGDFDPPSHAQTNAVQAGIAATNAQLSLFSHHFARGVSSFEHREPWLGWDYLYPPSVGYTHVETLAGYNATPVIPQILGEAQYENDPQLATSEDVRRQAWGALTSGAAGHFYGNRRIWAFGNGFEPADWKAALADPARQQMAHLKSFFTTRAWWRLVPDQASTLVTGGRGAQASASYVTAALASDRAWAVAYLPGGAGPITVRRSALSSSSIRARWFNPRTGAYTTIGAFPNQGTQTLSAPDANDWVLVLEPSPVIPGVPALPPRRPYLLLVLASCMIWTAGRRLGYRQLGS